MVHPSKERHSSACDFQCSEFRFCGQFVSEVKRVASFLLSRTAALIEDWELRRVAAVSCAARNQHWPPLLAQQSALYGSDTPSFSAYYDFGAGTPSYSASANATGLMQWLTAYRHFWLAVVEDESAWSHKPFGGVLAAGSDQY